MNIPEKITGDYDVYHLTHVLNAVIDGLHDIEARLPKPEAPKRWRAVESHAYWFVDDKGRIEEQYDNRGDYSGFRYNTGNYFLTKELAEEYCEQLLANGAQV